MLTRTQTHTLSVRKLWFDRKNLILRVRMCCACLLEDLTVCVFAVRALFLLALVFEHYHTECVRAEVLMRLCVATNMLLLRLLLHDTGAREMLLMWNKNWLWG